MGIGDARRASSGSESSVDATGLDPEKYSNTTDPFFPDPPSPDTSGDDMDLDVPTLPPCYLDKIPAEIQFDICKYLQPYEIIMMIRISPSIRKGIPNWNISYLNLEQLIPLHQFIEYALSSVPMPARLQLPDIREKIKDRFPKALKKFTKEVADPNGIEPSLLICHYSQIHKLSLRETLSREETWTFVKGLCEKNEAAREFCKRVSELDPHGKCSRSGKLDPTQDRQISCLLFSLAMEYIRENIKQRKAEAYAIDGDSISELWEEYVKQTDEVFGYNSGTSKLLKDSTRPIMSIVNYQWHIEACNSNHLAQIFDMLLCETDISAQTYATYVLSQGLGPALLFLDQDPGYLNKLADLPNNVFTIWGNFWEDLRSQDCVE